MDVEEIVSVLQTCISDIASRYPINLAYLYGSAAAGTATPLSDVDIALILDADHFKPEERLMLELKLEDLISQRCELSKADVRILNQAPIMVLGEVVTNGILVYSRDEEFRVDFETSTRSAFFDFQPIAAFHRQAYFDYLRQRGANGQSREDSESDQ